MFATRKIGGSKPGILEKTSQEGCGNTQHKGKNQLDKHLPGNDVRMFDLALGWGMKLIHVKNPFQNCDIGDY